MPRPCRSFPISVVRKKLLATKVRSPWARPSMAAWTSENFIFSGGSTTPTGSSPASR